MENFNLKLGLGVVFILAAAFAGYEYMKTKQDETKAILITDKIATSVSISEIIDLDKNIVDVLNTHTGEKHFEIKLSKECPKLAEMPLNQPVDVIQISYLNGQTGEVWNEFDGLYQKACWGKSIYNHSGESEQNKNPLPENSVVN